MTECKLCGNKEGKMGQSSNGREVWFACVDFAACDQRKYAREKQEAKQRQEKEMEDMEREFGVQITSKSDLVRIGVLFRDATEYYYHPQSDTVLGKSFFGGWTKASPVASGYARSMLKSKHLIAI